MALGRVFDHLPVADVLHCAQVCKAWLQQLDDDKARWQQFATAHNRPDVGEVPQLKAAVLHALGAHANLLAGRPTQQCNARHARFVRDVAWHPDGTRVLTTSDDGTARVIDASAGTEALRLWHRAAVNAQAHALCASWSPCGRHIATLPRMTTLRISAEDTGAPRVIVRHAGYVTAVRWSRDGTKVASASVDERVRITDALCGTSLWNLRQHWEDPVLSWGAVATQVLTADDAFTVHVVDIVTGVCVTRIRCADEIHDAQWNALGTRIAIWVYHETVGASEARIYDAQTGRLCLSTPSYVSPVWSPDGAQFMVAPANTVSIGDVASNAIFKRLEGVRVPHRLAWSPDSKKMALAHIEEAPRVYDVATGDCVASMSCMSEGVLHMQWAPDSSKLVVTASDGAVCVLDLATGAQIQRDMHHKKSVHAACWSPDGSQIVTASADQTARITDYGPRRAGAA